MDFNDSQLRSIFQLCSPDREGFILTDYLAEKLAQQFTDPALTAVQDALDPNRVGRISYDQFCNAVATLQSKQPVKSIDQHNHIDDNDSSDPENTYNEYDIPDDEISEMDNIDGISDSPHLSPVKSHDSPDYFKRNGSFRRSHKRVRSWASKSNGKSTLFEAGDETSSVTSEYDDLSEKIDKLQDHISLLEEEKSLQGQYESLKQENHDLTSRVNELEERLQDLSDRNEEMKVASQHKIEDLQREHSLELQVFQSKIEVLTSDKERLKSELDFSRSNAKECRDSLVSMQSQSEKLTKQIMETNEEYRRLSKRLSSQHDIHELERAKLREEAEEAKRMLRLSEDANEKLKSRLSETRFDPAAAKIRAHVDHLMTENEELKRSNEELSDQLAQEISEARLLICDESSIADELSSATRDEVMDALKKQEQINEQLRSYLERITLNILEINPEILEIK